MSKSKKHAPPVVASLEVSNQPPNVSAPDTVSATIYKFSEYTTQPTGADNGEQVGIPGLAQSADTDSVVLVSKNILACLSGVQISDEQVIWDCDNLTAGQLQAKYPREYNSHRNMKSRCKQTAAKGEKVHHDFEKFNSFLRHMKAAPEGKYTVDRIDNDDPEYAFGKVRWADKKTQNNNKGDNLKIHDPVTGMTFTAAQLAEKHGVQPDTIRRQRKRGWSDREIIAGKKSKSSPILNAIHSATHGPIFGPRADEPTWTKMIIKARKANDRHAIAELTSWKREYDARRAHHVRYRLENPDAFEDLLMKPADVNLKIYGSDCDDYPYNRDQWLEEFRTDWKQERMHVIYERCSPYHQQAIAAIDPEYIKRHNEALAQQAKLKVDL